MDDSDIIARIIKAVDILPQLPIEFAETDLGPHMRTPPRPLLEIYMVRRGWQFQLRGQSAEVGAGSIIITNAHFGSNAQATDPDQRHACVSLAIDGIQNLRELGNEPFLNVYQLRHDVHNNVWAACQANAQALRLGAHQRFCCAASESCIFTIIIGDC